MSSKDYLMLRSAQLARLEARTTSLRLCFRCTGFPGADLELELGSSTSPRPLRPQGRRGRSLLTPVE